MHNTFPHIADPDYGTDSVLLGFDDEEKRKRAIDLLIATAEYANRYGAQAVVVHPGEVPFDYNIDHELKGIYKEQGCESEAYVNLWNEMLERRESLSDHYLRRIQHSLEEACDRIAAKGWGVKIGIETRSRCNQMPTLLEAKTVIDRMQGAPVGLWYDFGHGMMMERMGLYDNMLEMDSIKENVVGIHIHETIGLSDHWCPYVHSGDMTYFDRFLPIIAAAPVKVYELKAACKPEEIEASHDLLISKLASIKV